MKKEKIKILFMIHDLGGGGAERVLNNLVNNLNPDSFDITILALFNVGNYQHDLNNNIKYKYVWNKPFPKNTSILKLFPKEKLHNMIVKDTYDIEVAYLEGSVHRIVAGCCNPDTRLLAWQHSYPHEVDDAMIGFRNYEEASACYEKYNGIACVSNEINDAMHKYYPSLNNLSVVHNVNDTDKIVELAKEPIDERLDGSAIKICCVGKLVKLKRVDRIIKVTRQLLDSGHNVQTLIIGTGPEEQLLKDSCVSYGITDKVIFTGFQTNPYKYISKCDIFVCASESEGFSTATTEALVLGLAVVSTPVSGARELLGDNEFGIVSEMTIESIYKCVESLVSNSQLLQDKRNASTKRGEMFLINKSILENETWIKSRL